MITQTSAPQLVEALTDGQELALIDVRERGCCARGRLLLSVNIELSQFEQKILSYVPRLSTRVILYDNDEGFTERAAAIMNDIGYSDVRVLSDNLKVCAANGLEIFRYHYVVTYAYGLYVAQALATPEIGPIELKAKMDAGENLVVLDTRQPPEFVKASIPGAINVPTTELIYHIKDLAPNPETQVFVNCGAITRGVLGAQTLLEAELENPVQVVANGVRGWMLQQFDLAHGSHDTTKTVSPSARDWSRIASERVTSKCDVTFITKETLDVWRGERTERTLYIIDVRTKDEYVQGHIHDARWILGSEVVGLYEDYLGTRNARVCLVDDNEARAIVAASWLVRLGWPDVVVLQGGICEHELHVGPEQTELPELTNVAVETTTSQDLAIAIEHDDVLVLDLANSATYEATHIPGSWWTIRANLPQLLGKLPPCKQIVVTSPDGFLAKLATKDLESLVNVPVKALAGGTEHWCEQGRPTVSGLTRVLGELDDLLADVTVRSNDDWTTARDCARRMVDWQNELLEKIERDISFSFPPLS